VPGVVRGFFIWADMAKRKDQLDEYRQNDEQELAAEIERLEQHMFDLRSQRVTEKLEEPSQLTKARRQIARIKTLLRERELAKSEQ